MKQTSEIARLQRLSPSHSVVMLSGAEGPMFDKKCKFDKPELVGKEHELRAALKRRVGGSSG